MKILTILMVGLMLFTVKEYMTLDEHTTVFNRCNNMAQKDFKECFNTPDYRVCFVGVKATMRECLDTGVYGK